METFKERRANNDGSYFLLIYEGTPIELSRDDRSEVDRRLRMFMDNKDIHTDVIKNVSYIRTIFIDFDEEYIYMKYHDNNKDEMVEYKNKELTLYDLKSKESEAKKKGKNKINNDAYQKRNETLSKLKNIGPVGIGPNEYKLIVAYNYFFNMHPNFVSKNINIQFQCMIQILSKFGVQLLELNDYCYDEERGIMISPLLDKIVGDLFPYGMIRGINEKEINDLDKRKISIIGDNVNNNIQGINRLQELINITRLLCPTEKDMENINRINEMNNNLHNLELVKKIKSEIE